MNVVHEAGLFQGHLGFPGLSFYWKSGCSDSATFRAWDRYVFRRVISLLFSRRFDECWSANGYSVKMIK